MLRADANNLYDGIVEISKTSDGTVIGCGWVKETTIRHGDILTKTIFRGI